MRVKGGKELQASPSPSAHAAPCLPGCCCWADEDGQRAALELMALPLLLAPQIPRGLHIVTTEWVSQVREGGTRE